MEKPLKFVLTLSLKEMVFRRVAVLLFPQNDLEIISHYFFDDWESWLKTHEDKVKYKISKLLLPKSLRKEMIDKVRHVSLEIGKWILEHGWMFFSPREIGIPAKFHWTTAGTLDHKKTAEALLGCEVLGALKRYRLACYHCLEDYIPLLLEELDEDKKEWFHSETRILPSLAFCWPHILKGEVSNLDCLWRGSDRNLTSFNQWAFEDSVSKGNKSASEYFFLKLTHEEREVSVMRTTLALLSDLTYGLDFGLFSDVLNYLLSIMTPEQQMETIEKEPIGVLLSFFVMFWQDLLVENAGVIWPFLPTSGYGKLSEEILEIAGSDEYHPKSFREIFITSPLKFKKYFVYHEYGEDVNSAALSLGICISNEDSDSIECIFRNVDAADRVGIVFQPDVLDLFHRSVRKKDGRRMVEVCLREAELCKEDRERLKKERPDLRGVIEELYESDATPENEKKG